MSVSRAKLNSILPWKQSNRATGDYLITKSKKWQWRTSERIDSAKSTMKLRMKIYKTEWVHIQKKECVSNLHLEEDSTARKPSKKMKHSSLLKSTHRKKAKIGILFIIFRK
jgi:hypothetical protein